MTPAPYIDGQGVSRCPCGRRLPTATAWRCGVCLDAGRLVPYFDGGGVPNMTPVTLTRNEPVLPPRPKTTTTPAEPIFVGWRGRTFDALAGGRR